MISTNELSFPMPAANLIAQRDPMRFVDTALYADDCAAESVTLVRADFLAADACGRFPAVALIEIMAHDHRHLCRSAAAPGRRASRCGSASRHAPNVAAHCFLHAGRQTFLQSSKEI